MGGSLDRKLVPCGTRREQAWRQLVEMFHLLDVNVRKAHAFVDKVLRQPCDVLRLERFPLCVVAIPATEVNPLDSGCPLRLRSAVYKQRDDVVITAVACDVEGTFAILPPGVRVGC